MDTYNVDPTHAGKNDVIDPVNSDWEIQGSLREMHGFLKSVTGGADSHRKGHLSRPPVCLHGTD